MEKRKKIIQRLTVAMRTLALLLCYFVTLLSWLPCHAIGEWKAYLAYSDITEIEKAGEELFVLASKNLYLYNTQDQSVRTFSKMDALSDCGIAHIAWNQKANRLVIIYENENKEEYNSSVRRDRVRQGRDVQIHHHRGKYRCGQCDV